MSKPIALLVTTALLASTGCSVAGKWSLASVDPSAARRDFPFEVLTLEEDGSFYAEAREAGKTRSTSGTYRYENEVLTLKEHDGEVNTFRAEMPNNNELHLERSWQDRVVIGRMERKE